MSRQYGASASRPADLSGGNHRARIFPPPEPALRVSDSPDYFRYHFFSSQVVSVYGPVGGCVKALPVLLQRFNPLLRFVPLQQRAHLPFDSSPKCLFNLP